MRTFDQILSDVTAQSDPQRKVILNQIASLPGQESAAESGLTAQKDQAYQDILGGARQRGLGFSGIPLAEQAKYNATNYAPAVANLKSTYANNQNTLEGALASVGSNNYSTANNIYGQDQQLALQQQQAAEQQRQFNANLDFQRQQAAKQGGSNDLLSKLFQQQQDQQKQNSNDPYAALGETGKNNAHDAIVGLLKSNNQGTIAQTIAAIGKSAQYGNKYDQYKIGILRGYLNNSPYASLINQAISGPSVAKGIL